MDPDNALIKVDSVTKGFNSKLVLDNVSLKINAGDIFGLIGASGSGKTTLLNLIIGFLKPEEGDVKIDIKCHAPSADAAGSGSVYSNLVMIKRLLGFSAQKPSFYDGLTVRENLIYFGTLYDLPDDVLARNIETALNLVGMKEQEHEIAENLSGGMQKRLDIACAMIHNPKILLLDEPTADLDTTLRKQIWNVISRINKAGTTIIIATHFLEDVEHLCNRVAVLHGRKIIEQGNLLEIKKHYIANQEVHLKTAKGDYKEIIELLRKDPDIPITKVLLENNKLVVHSPNAEKVLHNLVHITEHLGYDIDDIYMDNPSLDEVFESLVERSKDKKQ